MPNKHAAGCQCCAEGECSPCTKTITNVSVTYGDETVSWSVNKAINAIPGCTLVLRYCGTPTVYDLLDYSIDQAWDGRIGDCWKAFSPPQYPFTTTGSACMCAEPPPPPGGGGGPGGGPVTPGVCTLCSTHVAPYRFTPPGQEGLVGGCDLQRYYIVTQAVNDVHVRLQLKVWDEVDLSLVFLGGSPDQVFQAGVSVTRKTEVQSFLKYEVVNYYNDYCPKDVDCNAASAPTCQPTEVDIQYEWPGWGPYYCEFGTQFPTVPNVPDGSWYLLHQDRFLGCDDTPNWIELTTSKYCVDSHCTECNWDIETCLPGDNDIPDWQAQNPGDPLCYFIYTDPNALPQRMPDDFSDWPQYNQDGPRKPMSFTCGAMLGTTPFTFTRSQDACFGEEPPCFGYKCGQTGDQFVNYIETITVPCNELCSAHTLDRFSGPASLDDITLEFTRCVLTQCAEGDAPETPCTAGVSELWLEDCCLDTGPAPATVTIPFSAGWPGPTVTLTIACAP